MGAISMTVVRRRARLRRALLAIGLGLAALLVLSVFWLFLSRALAIAHLRAQLEQLEERREQLLAERAHLEELLGRKDDPAWIEYLARKELGLILPGEEKWIVVEEGR